jgi:hypothetical protein
MNAAVDSFDNSASHAFQAKLRTRLFSYSPRLGQAFERTPTFEYASNCITVSFWISAIGD